VNEHAVAAFLRACRLDVEVRKPGNVSVASPGHGMTAQQFIDAAEVCAPAMFATGAPVGERIEASARASLDVAGCNTNLGILLLTAPLAAALERTARQSLPLTEAAWRMALAETLGALEAADATAAFRAIALANPGGLSRRSQHDVRQPPAIGLVAAMAEVAAVDRIAAQYVRGHADLFDFGLPAFRAHRAAGDAMQACFLHFLASGVDSHIVRKHGINLAQTVTDRAGRLAERSRAAGLAPLQAELADWDAELKASGINPGTTADLTVATAFIAGVLDAAPRQACPGPVA
jgi:triphosphoribosyl-dephospho-CoA synthase